MFERRRAAAAAARCLSVVMAVGVLALALDVSAAEPPSLVSLELFHYGCRSELAVQELTFFGNGTLRLRDGTVDNPEMRLLELAPSEREAFIARLEDLRFDDAESFAGSLEGAWIDQCRLTLELPGRPPFAFRFHRFDSLSLELQRGVDLGNELVELVRERAVFDGLPASYEPQVGDFLRRADGEIFEIVGYTADGLGVELVGYEQPTGMWVAIADLPRIFVALEEGL